MLVAGLMSIGVSGCDAQNPAKAPDRKVVTPPGIAPVGFDMQDAGRAAPQQQAAQQQPAAVPQPMPQAQPAPANDGKGIIGQSTNQVVEMRPAMAQNPNLKIIENKAAGDDPLTFACSAYIALRSRASMLGFEAALKQHKIVEMRNLTYQEFLNMMKENRVEFTAVYGWQTYAYDPQDGRLVVLEDSTRKPRQ
jgi:hypothetical protein